MLYLKFASFLHKIAGSFTYANAIGTLIITIFISIELTYKMTKNLINSNNITSI
jgi:hypothetical protein